MTSVSSVVSTILTVGSRVQESIVYVALLLWPATSTIQIIVAPTTTYLDVALEMRPLVSVAAYDIDY